MNYKIAFLEEGIEVENLEDDLNDFVTNLQPLEAQHLTLLRDKRTSAVFLECHIPALMLIEFGTTDVPLDPEAGEEYRANRELIDDHSAYIQMEADAENGRRFSNLVAEYVPSDTPPLKL